MKNIEFIKLKDIALIRSGHLIGTSLKSNYNNENSIIGYFNIITLKHVNENGKILCNDFPKIAKNEYRFSNNVILKEGDIIIKAKSTVNTAALIDKDFLSQFKDIQFIPTAHFFIIRLNTDLIIPEFLLWFLNHPGTQFFIKNNNPNYMLRFLKKNFLENIEIPLLYKNKQKEIIKMEHIFNKREQILNLLLEDNKNHKKYIMDKVYLDLMNRKKYE